MTIWNMMLFTKIIFRSQWFILNKISINRSLTKSHPTPIKQKVFEKDGNREWHTIYHLPMIRWVASFHKLKFYQLGIISFGAPISFALENLSQFPPQTTLVVLSLGFTGAITLSLASYLCQNVIGFIYIDSEGKHLRFSYVDFWGKRNNLNYNLEDVMNINYSIGKLYQIVQMNDTKSPTYKLMYRFGEIKDPDSFASIFGD